MAGDLAYQGESKAYASIAGLAQMRGTIEGLE
jgi:hypothetical protein